MKFFFRYVLGLRKPKTAALHVGVAVHGRLSDWNRARWRQQPLALADLYTTYQRCGKASESEEPVAWDERWPRSRATADRLAAPGDVLPRVAHP